MSDLVALVTGASRGLGRGIARGLGSLGMTVYLTGRSADELSDAAREVDAAGGKGIPLVCDHGDDSQVANVFARITAEAGKLDLLVNNAAAVHPNLTAPGGFWEKDLALADMITIGLRSDYVAAWHAVPLMLKTGGGLIANISFYGAASYFVGPAYGAAKAGTDKMVHDMAQDLAGRDLSIVSFWPGYVMTDRMKAVPPDMLPEAIRAILPEFESPEFSGLVLAALHADPDRLALSGKALIGAELARGYGIRDLDGKQPRDWTAVLGRPLAFFEKG